MRFFFLWGWILMPLLMGCQSKPYPFTIPSHLNSHETERYELENGLTVLLKRAQGSGLAAAEVAVRAGSITEGEWLGSGISHFIEHMLFKGTKVRPVGQVEREIQGYGGTFNAFTSYEYTGYQIVVPKENLPGILDLLSDVLQNSAFDPEELERERLVILKEIALNHDDPERQLHVLAWSRAYTTHPYRHPIIGYESLLKALTQGDLIRYYRQRYAANNLILVLVGDFDDSKARALIQEKFSGIPRRSLYSENIPSEPIQMSPRKSIIEGSVELAHLLMLYHTVSLRDKDLYPLDVLAILLGAGESSHFNRVLHRKLGLVHTVSCWSYTPRDPGVFVIASTLEPEKVESTITAILEELRKVAQAGFTERDIEKAKRSVLADYLATHQTVQAQASDLVMNEFLTGDPTFSAQYVKGVEQVKLEDVQRVLGTYFRPEGLTIAGLVPKRSAKEAIKEQTAKAISSFTQGMRMIKFSNGLTLLLKPDSRVGLVSLAACFQGGLASEKTETPGISNFVSQLTTHGTTRQSSEEIAEWVESRGGTLSPFSGHNSFGITLDLMKEDTQEGIRLIGQLVRESNFPQAEIERIRHLIQAAIKGQNEEVFESASKELKEALFQIHPFRFTQLGTEESIRKIQRKDLLDYYRRFALPRNFVLSIVGDMDPAQVEQWVRQTFQDWPDTGAIDISPPPEPPIAEPRVVEKTMPKEQAIVMIAFHSVSLLSPDRYAFDFLTAVLSGGSGTLYDAIRQKEGLAYSVGAYGVTGMDLGYYVFYAATSHEAIDRVKELLWQEIRQLRERAVDSETFERARQELIGNNRIRLQSFGSLAFKTALNELYGLGYQEVDDYENQIRKISAEDLQRIARHYFDPDRSAQLILDTKSR